VKLFAGAGSDPLIARIILRSLLERYRRERVRDELMRQAMSVGTVSIAKASDWQRPVKFTKAGAAA
jgi:hypothetical protein